MLGGNRYIGRHLVFELARRGHTVTVVNSHLSPLPDCVERVHADRRHPGALDAVLGDRRDDFDVVYDNTSYVPADVAPLVALFRGRVEHFVFTSSSAVYRRSLVQPVHEGSSTHAADDTDPRKAYGVGKVQCEQYLLGEHARDGFPATSLRVGHTIGPHTPLVSREPIFFRRLELGRPILIPGEGFPFVHLVHVGDVARLMASIAGNPAAPGEIYNVFGRQTTSIVGCMKLMARVVGVEPDIINVPLDIARRARPPLVHWGEAIVGGATFSIDKALAHLDWEPQLGLEAAYRDSYSWFASEGRDLFDYDFASDDVVLGQLTRPG